MIPLADIHCHLLAGLDDGPRTQDEAVEMCRLAWHDGIRAVAATAHQNESYPEVTVERIRQATGALVQALQAAGVPLSVFPSGEVMVRPGIEQAWKRGDLASVADRGKYLLIELPHQLFLDLVQTVQGLMRNGVRPILAHAEREPVLLHEPRQIEALVAAGCLIQVNASSITATDSPADQRLLRAWFRRGLVHIVSSDGHSPRSRAPRMAAAYEQIAAWAGTSMADQVCSTNPTAILYGLPLRIHPPQPRRLAWLGRLIRPSGGR